MSDVCDPKWWALKWQFALLILFSTICNPLLPDDPIHVTSIRELLQITTTDLQITEKVIAKPSHSFLVENHRLWLHRAVVYATPYYFRSPEFQVILVIFKSWLSLWITQQGKRLIRSVEIDLKRLSVRLKSKQAFKASNSWLNTVILFSDNTLK